MEIKKQSLQYENIEIQKTLKNNSMKKIYKMRGFFLIIITLCLALFGILNIASASFYSSMRLYNNEYLFLRNQIKYLFVSIIPLIFGIVFDYKKYETKKIILILLGIAGLLFGIIFVGTFLFKMNFLVPSINGSRRWINLKFFRLQPSEILKVVYIIFIAKGLHQAKKKKFKNQEILFFLLPIIFIFTLLVFLQKDLGTSLHYIAISAIMIFFSDIDLKFLFKITVIIAIIGLLLGGYSYFFGDSSYRNRRIKSYVNGIRYDNYDNGDGYQIKQSLIAIGSGGVVGKGLANGTQKYDYLPEMHTDFILASIGEEWGLIGIFVMFIFYTFLLRIGMLISKDTSNYFGKYLSIGITGYLFSQIIMNIYVVTGLMPVTGIPLPLISYGGSSLLTTLLLIGILYNINLQNYKKNNFKGGSE